MPLSRHLLRLPMLAAGLVVCAASLATPAAQAAFPGSNGAIAYTHWNEPFGGDDVPGAGDDPDSIGVRTLAPGTTSHIRLPDSPNAGELSAAYSPDGTLVAWAVVTKGGATGGGIYVAAVDGGAPRKIAAARDAAELAWTASGDRVASASERRGIQLFSPSGGSKRTLVARRRGWTPSAPSFSADGERMAYAWYRLETDGSESVRSEIWAAEADGTGARRILGGGSGPLARVGEPDFSPDSASLAVVTMSKVPLAGRNAVFVTRADGKAPRKIAASPRLNTLTEAIWSPDGQQLLVSRLRFGPISGERLSIPVSTTLLTIDPRTRVQTERLRAPKTFGYGLAWQPLPMPEPGVPAP